MKLKKDMICSLDNLSEDQLGSIAKFIQETNSDVQINKPKPLLQLHIQDIIKASHDIQTLGLIIGGQDGKLERWFESIHIILTNYYSELKQEERRLNQEFIKSLDTIAKIFQVLKNYQKEAQDGSLLSCRVQKLIDDYRQNEFVNLAQYCNEAEPMSQVNREVENGILKLKPMLVEKIVGISKEIRGFYSRLEIVDEYDNPKFLEQLPSPEESQKYSTIEEVDDIKGIMSTNFSRSSPALEEKIKREKQKLEKFISQKCSLMRNTMDKLRMLENELERTVDLDLQHYCDEELIQHIGIKKASFEQYNNKLKVLLEEKSNRERQLKDLMERLEDLWAVLRPKDNSIQEFLKVNRNIKRASISNFEALVEELEQEKRENISKFIQTSRMRILGYWDLLMYDEEDRLKFEAFYDENPDNFDEDLLDRHNQEIAKLRAEVDKLKPLLESITKLDDLLKEKSYLDEAVKDPNRLLKRDSFKILRHEEKIREKLARQLPSTIRDLKLQLNSFEIEKGRAFKVNGEPYISRLEEIESELGRKRSFRKSPIKTLPANSSSRVCKREPTKTATRKRNHLSMQSRLPSTVQRLSQSVNSNTYKSPASFGSVIRRQNTESMTNPFNSRESSPLRKTVHSRQHAKASQLQDITPDLRFMSPIEPPVFSNPADPSLVRSVCFMSGSTISNKPIVIKGGSPIRQNSESELHTRSHLKMPSLSPPTRVPPSNAILQGPAESTSLKPLNCQLKASSPSSSLIQDRVNGSIVRPSDSPNTSNAIPVAELSDSMIDYSEEVKENVSPRSYKAHGKAQQMFLNDVSMNWDTETF
ncbi:Anaphase spindle elongation protein 1 [Ogataea parapolymorpha DL-1]|uniref:Anaphase spindle elongation protein 1 n=1 Tax=Ogataea parapolymorpha (strain ATCC 26012 / BCRC 20466 / JCM 22074 / NRRL Y-7560 / DL-1) TaxID=871575 RepID=W1Q7T0_OGAPD|nr:Anaphase spindle elongation protein 1 [Ogataea parapolymorpha DL-1]ESW96037.1 Anaphase spindle elongation protein 1 [Ogataea parapolymorpha DL-1]